jgi:hypothetical protein
MNEEPTNESKGTTTSTMVGLVLAFVPSALILVLIKSDGGNYLVPACIISIICCFTSSFMLFSRGTGWSVFLGLTFLVLNVAIAFFLGCTASIHF